MSHILPIVLKKVSGSQFNSFNCEKNVFWEAVKIWNSDKKSTYLIVPSGRAHAASHIIVAQISWSNWARRLWNWYYVTIRTNCDSTAQTPYKYAGEKWNDASFWQFDSSERISGFLNWRQKKLTLWGFISITRFNCSSRRISTKKNFRHLWFFKSSKNVRKFDKVIEICINFF